MVIRWICEVTLKDRKGSEDIRQRLGISVCNKAYQRRLRWFRHVGDCHWGSEDRDMLVDGERGRGIGRKT